MYRTDWFRFKVEVREGKVLRLEPVNIPARRVRALESKDGTPVTRRELVRDVVMDSDEEKKATRESDKAPVLSR
jgi:hypothetical protein